MTNVHIYWAYQSTNNDNIKVGGTSARVVARDEKDARALTPAPRSS